jgi:hypothetical protein
MHSPSANPRGSCGIVKLDLLPPQPKLTAHPHDFSVSDMDFDQLRTPNALPIFVQQRRHLLLRMGIKHVWRVTPRIFPIETEIHPTMPTFTQLDTPLGCRRHLGRIKNEQLFPILITDPQFLF